MAQTTGSTADAILLPTPRPAGAVHDVYHGVTRFIRRYPLGAVGGALIALLALVAIFAPVIATHDQYSLSSQERLQAPSREHFFGTDELGRDIFSRIVYGARISLQVGFIAVGLGVVFGTFTGLACAYFGGATDFWLQRLVDALFAFPTIILALAIVAVLGPSTTNVVIAVGIVSIPRIARVVRASALGVMAQPFIEASRSMGSGHTRIVFRHIFPNVLAPIIVMATAGFGAAILSEAALSFLGVGTPPPEPSWGIMLSGAAQQFIRVAPWMAIFPGIAISLAVFGFNLFGDALRDALDPRLRTA
ncbi:MAG: ABC transporter permease [Dehalococcoidia bacterium]